MLSLFKKNQKNRNLLVSISVIVSLLFLLIPIVIFAQASTGSGSADVFQIENPIKADSLQGLLYDILSIIVQIAIPILVVATIYVGFLFVSAGGNPGKIGNAQKAATNLLIGSLIVLGAFAIAEGIKNTVEQIGPVEVPIGGN
ncbi:MAG: hypothetical protein UV50_C0012G0015 [Parcubacteria group bacterium GW2011_GWB1_42_9]|nr:MAG: hypothetical protein UV50_C0012G0015 [Parcubacteria group bacterium GW2011_GWB1_42_9]